jgi:hypothetical protein
VVAFGATSQLNAFGAIGGLLLVIAVMLGAFAAVLAVLGAVGPFVLKLFAKGWLKRAARPAQLIAARTVLDDVKASWRQIGSVAMVSFVAVFTGIGVAFTQTTGGNDPATELLAIDIRTGVVLTLVMSFAMVACGIGVNQAAVILDRRSLYVSLDRIGMPVRVMDAGRRRAVMAPLLVVTIGSAVSAAIVLFPLTGYTLLLRPLGLAVIAGCLALGIGIVWIGLAATRRVLERVVAAGAPDLT